MEINSLQNYYRLQNTANTCRVKRNVEENTPSASESYGTDKVAISSDASFKAELSSLAKTYSAQSAKTASQERIEALKEAYREDNCPVSGRDIASAVMKYALGTNSRT